MAIGMTYEQYWYDDPLMVRAFYKANKIRQAMMDEEAWLNGMYVLNALNASVGNMFRKTGQTPIEYPKEPISMTREREKRAKKAEEEDREATWALAWMTSFVRAGKRFDKNKQQRSDVPCQTGQLTT